MGSWDHIPTNFARKLIPYGLVGIGFIFLKKRRNKLNVQLYKKVIFQTPALMGMDVKHPYIFARNHVTYPDLPRKIMSGTPTSLA